jgi:hypothetical protein
MNIIEENFVEKTIYRENKRFLADDKEQEYE